MPGTKVTSFTASVFFRTLNDSGPNNEYVGPKNEWGGFHYTPNHVPSIGITTIPSETISAVEEITQLTQSIFQLAASITSGVFSISPPCCRVLMSPPTVIFCTGDNL